MQMTQKPGAIPAPPGHVKSLDDVKAQKHLDKSNVQRENDGKYLTTPRAAPLPEPLTTAASGPSSPDVSAHSSDSYTTTEGHAVDSPSLQDTIYSKESTSSRFYPPPPPEHGQVFIFLFVNPTSGGNAAGAFTNAGLNHATLSQPTVDLYIADIRDGPSGQKPAFRQMRELVEGIKAREAHKGPKPDRVFAIMAGGDGTILWGISEMWEHGIDDSIVTIGVIPYGTGNDFARALDWNAFNALSPFANNMIA